MIVDYPTNRSSKNLISIPNIKVCVSNICPGIIQEDTRTYLTLPYIEVEDEEEYMRMNRDRHTNWVELQGNISLTKKAKVWVRVLKPLVSDSMDPNRTYYVTDLVSWSPHQNQKELEIIQSSLRKKATSYEVGAMEL